MMINKGFYQGLIIAAILTASLGRIHFGDHAETWYNLNMTNVVEKAHSKGIGGAYWVREDGCKMLGDFIMCAGAPERYGEMIETSRGPGIIVDTGSFAKKHPKDVDLATIW